MEPDQLIWYGTTQNLNIIQLWRFFDICHYVESTWIDWDMMGTTQEQYDVVIEQFL